MGDSYPGAGNRRKRVFAFAGFLLFLAFVPAGLRAQPLAGDLPYSAVLPDADPLDLPPDVRRSPVPAPLVDDLLYGAIFDESTSLQTPPKKKRRPRLAGIRRVMEGRVPEDCFRGGFRKPPEAFLQRLHTCLCLGRPPPAAPFLA